MRDIMEIKKEANEYNWDIFIDWSFEKKGGNIKYDAVSLFFDENGDRFIQRDINPEDFILSLSRDKKINELGI